MVTASPSWHCQHCKKYINGHELIFQAYQDGEALISDKTKRTVENYEKYVCQYESVLHPHHICLVRIKYSLVGFYGRMPGYRWPQMAANPKLLERKLALGNEVLSVLEKTEPGISSSKGVILYELHMPTFLLAQLNLNRGNIDAITAQKELKQSIEYITASIEHLKFNSKGSFGHQLYIAAQASLQHFQKWVQ